MLERIARLVERFPAAMLCLTLALAGALGLGAFDRSSGKLRLRVDPGTERLLPTGDRDRAVYENTVKRFGNDQALLLALGADQVFSVAFFQALEQLDRRLVRMPGVARVVSLASVPNPRTEGEELDLATFTQAGLAEPALLPKLRADVLAHPLYSGVLASRDGRASSLLITLREQSEQATQETVAAVRAAAEEEAPGAVHLTGAAVVKNATARILLRELGFAVPAVFGISCVVLLIAFRSIRIMLMGILTITLATVMTLGVLGWVGRPLNLVTVIVPPFVITLGLAYAMHVLEAFVEVEGSRARVRAADALRRIGVAVFVTVLTTGAGLAALGIHPLAAIREFGWLAFVGVLFTALMSIFFLPAALALFGHPTRRIMPFESRFRRAGEALATFSLAHRKAILRGGFTFLALAALATTQLEVGTAYIENLPQDDPARSDYDAIERHFGSATTLLVAFDTNHRDAILEPEFLTRLENFQVWLAEQPEVTGSVGVTDHLKTMHAAWMAPEGGFELPGSAELARQLLVFAGGDVLREFTDAGFRRTLLRVRASTNDTRVLAQLIRRIEAQGAELPGSMSLEVTGEAVLLTQTLTRIARGQFQSVVGALVLIYGVLAALFSSLRVGLLALLPNALPIAFYFGVLAVAGIPLSPATSLIACIALGIAVDDTIHYLVRFNAEARRTTDEEEATHLALRAILRPVTFTSIALCLGFLVFVGSDLRNQVQFGALAAATLAFAWLVDVVLTPALCSGVRIVTLWDVLRLDLGSTPQTSISLFEGLSQRQTRLFALTADIQNFDAGDSVRREGEHARDMFVVLEGEVEVWTTRDEQRVVIHQANRGDMVGEFSFFAERHGATVDAVTQARLLRFEDIDLELMMRRYPRAAAKIYRNLNKIQAARLLDASGRLESLSRRDSMGDEKPLTGQVAFVTGAARGIGRGIAIGLARAGADIVVSDLESGAAGVQYELADKSSLEAVAAEISALGVRSLAVTCDVTQKGQVDAAVAACADAFGGLDIVVNNAGVVHFEPLQTFDEARWDLLFAVNVKGVFLVSQAAIPHLIEREGNIINIASVAGKRGYPAGTAYCGTKFAVVGITQSLASELGPSGVRVNAICPGILDTAMWSDHLSDLMGEAVGKQGRAAFDNAVGQFIPLGREQTPEDIAEAAVYLAHATNVSGISLNVAGGMEGW